MFGKPKNKKNRFCFYLSNEKLYLTSVRTYTEGKKFGPNFLAQIKGNRHAALNSVILV